MVPSTAHQNFTIFRNSFHYRLTSIKNEAWQSYVYWYILISKAHILIIKISPQKCDFSNGSRKKPFGLGTWTFGILLYTLPPKKFHANPRGSYITLQYKSAWFLNKLAYVMSTHLLTYIRSPCLYINAYIDTYILYNIRYYTRIIKYF